MRAHAELAATTERLAEAARRGPDAEAVHSRLGALKLLVGDIIAEVEGALPDIADAGPGHAGARPSTWSRRAASGCGRSW